MLAQSASNGLGAFFVQYKEVIAGVGVVLGLVPRIIDLARQATSAQKEQRALLRHRQRLELMKLQYEVVEYEQKYGPEPAAGIALSPATLEQPLPGGTVRGEPPAPSSPPPRHTGATAEGRPSDALLQASAEEPKPPPAIVQWLIARPSLGKPVLWTLHASILFLLLGSGLVTIVFPLSVMGDSAEFGASAILVVEAIYILMTLAFWALYLKVGRWRELMRLD